MLIGSVLALVGVLVFTATGQLSFKLFFSRGRLFWFLAAGFLFVGAQLCNYGALLELQLGTVYMTTSLIYPLVLILAHYVLKEDVTKERIVAALLIVTGVIIYNV